MEHIDITPERPSRPSHPLARALGLALGGLLAVYLVVRGIAEFFVIHYSDPASYRLDWGGPSLAGVFAVHSGPAVVILAGAGIWLRRRWRRSHTSPSRHPVDSGTSGPRYRTTTM